MMTTKSNELKLKDFNSKQGIVEFYFASFNTKDAHNDIIKKGAYTKTIQENRSRIKHLKNHNPTQAIGVITELYEDEVGAIAVCQLAKTTLGRDTLIEYEEGIITEHSHGFQTIKEEYNAKKDANIIKEVRLWEVSSLTHWGANENTPTLGVKSYENALQMMKNIHRVLKSTSITDERAKELELQHKKIGELLKSLENEPSADTQKEESIDSNKIILY